MELSPSTCINTCFVQTFLFKSKYLDQNNLTESDADTLNYLWMDSLRPVSLYLYQNIELFCLTLNTLIQSNRSDSHFVQSFLTSVSSWKKKYHSWSTENPLWWHCAPSNPGLPKQKSKGVHQYVGDGQKWHTFSFKNSPAGNRWAMDIVGRQTKRGQRQNPQQTNFNLA